MGLTGRIHTDFQSRSRQICRSFTDRSSRTRYDGVPAPESSLLMPLKFVLVALPGGCVPINSGESYMRQTIEIMLQPWMRTGSKSIPRSVLDIA